MGIAIERDAERNTVRLEGAIGIGCAAELKQALIEALEPGKQVRVALDEVNDLDVTAAQLLWAARRETQESVGRSVVIGPFPAPVHTTLADAGFDPTLLMT